MPLSDKTKVPLGWIFGLIGCSFTILMVAGGLVLWGARLEAKTEGKVDKLDYVQDVAEIKRDLKDVKRALKIEP